MMNSGDIVYITEAEKVKVDEALRLRDEQIEKLIKNTQSIINELTTLNGTASSIDNNTTETASNTRNIAMSASNAASNTSSILSQTRSNGTLLSQIKSVCDSILAWVRNR